MFNFKIDQVATFLSLSLLVLLLLYVNNNIWSKNIENNLSGEIGKLNNPPNLNGRMIRNILLWTHNHTEPFNRFKYGRESFIDEGCGINNCFVTNQRNYLQDITEWDAILFHAPEFTWPHNPWNHGFPSRRKPEQIFIFACIESASNYPICSKNFNGYFNWTMTYKLDSDVPWQYIVVRDATNIVVGPKRGMKWVETKEYITDDLKKVLKNKKKAAAWFVSNCSSLSKRLEYARTLKKKLEDLGFSLDIYGKCGDLKCDLNDQDTCMKKLRDDYYFYLSFENSFSEDYVTEKFLMAVQHNTVPITLGGADYSRFAPNNSFINGKSYSPLRLATVMKRLIENHTEYEEYFRWTRRYSYHDPVEIYETHPFCKLCKALDDQRTNRVRKTYEDFQTWWEGDGNSTKRC